MAIARFKVAQAGPHVTVQDGGRHRMLRYGVPASGPMDRLAFAAANVAVGNPVGATGIEVSRGGLVLDCIEGAVSLAVAGGGFRVDVGPQSPGSWTTATITAGTRLVIRPGPWGSWTYLAFAGELQSARWLGRAATHGPSGLGGGMLRTGDEVLVADAGLTGGNGAIPCPVIARPRNRVRVVPGPQDRFFDTDAMDALLTRPFALTDAYDRMGVRLAGPVLHPNTRLDMPSEGLLRGSVQVAGDGVATVLLADHQTTGGYPKIATVLDCDLDQFVQLRSRDMVRFHPVTPAQAIATARIHARATASYLAALAG